MTRYIASVDQGTTSTRFMIFDDAGAVVGIHQLEHTQIYPQAGWVEHDPLEIWARTQDVIKGGLAKADLTANDLAAIGITNQRETTVVWNPRTGQPYYNAIVWQDTRTDRICGELARATAGRTASGRRPACRWRPISPARRSSGSSTTCPACARRRSGARRSSATSTRGSSGI